MNLNDAAQDHEAKEWLMRQQSRTTQALFQPGERGYGPAECHGCDDPMPALRRAHGWGLCVPCKTAEEVRGKRR